MGWKASKNNIIYYLISRESKPVISNILYFREQFHFRAKIKSDIKEKLFIVHAKLKSGQSFFFLINQKTTLFNLDSEKLDNA